MAISANTVLNEARKLIGTVMGTTTHHNIVDLYNATKPLPVGYKAKYTDGWCNITVSVIGIKVGEIDLIGRECGVHRHIDIFKSKGFWIEDGKITPRPGDIVVFNLDDVTQPNDGWADHSGFVKSVSNGVINGALVNGDDRKKKLAAAGYSYDAVQTKVIGLLKGSSSNQSSTNPFANIAVNDKWETDLNKYLQRYYDLKTVDGIIPGQIKGAWNSGIIGITFGTGGSDLVAAIQKDLGLTVDRNMGPRTIGSI
ncbi:hypothetical protein FG877_10470 [Enterococcus casseliflavus]|nr:hypothetical protein [Enterococcus casseliflavus]